MTEPFDGFGADPSTLPIAVGIVSQAKIRDLLGVSKAKNCLSDFKN